MKKLAQTLSLVAILFSSAVLAQQPSPRYFYVSANAGIFQADFNNVYLENPSIFGINLVQPTAQHGYTGGLSLGYRQLFCQQYFLGGELSGNIEGHYASFQGFVNLPMSDMIQIKNHVDLTFVPGMMLNDTTAMYLKLGLSRASIQDNLTSDADGVSSLIVRIVNSNRNALGFAAGLGFEKWVTEHTVLFVEANYHDYGSVNFSTFENFISRYSHTAHVYSYSAVVGASYAFNV